MPLYESVFIARQDISSAQVDGLADNFTKIVTDNGGSVQKREYWGLRNLAYRMKKNRKGHYILFNIDAPAAAVHEMERNMRINEDILRYMTLRIEALREGPSPVMQGRGERDRDRGDRFDRGPRGEGRRGPRGDRDHGGESSESGASDAESPKRRPRANAETESEEKGGEA